MAVACAAVLCGLEHLWGYAPDVSFSIRAIRLKTSALGPGLLSCTPSGSRVRDLPLFAHDCASAVDDGLNDRENKMKRQSVKLFAANVVAGPRVETGRVGDEKRDASASVWRTVFDVAARRWPLCNSSWAAS